MSNNMKAATRKKYCSPEQIKITSIAKPTPKKDEILIRIHATSVNRTDCANLTAKPFIMRFVLGLIKPRQIVLGTEFAGVVESVGNNVKSVRIGSKVFGFNDIGSASQAEYMISGKTELFSIPENINFQQAAGSLEGAHYAYSFIHKVNIKPGQKVLINGATGGIGSALLQFTKEYNAKISATCDASNIDLIKSLGAEKVFDYNTEDFTKGSEKYDFIFDAVGKSTFKKCKPVLKNGGTYISSEPGPYSQNVFLPILTLFSSKKVIFPIPFNKKTTIPFISNFLATGKFKPLIDREYPLNDIAKAYKYVIKGNKTGNVIITVTD